MTADDLVAMLGGQAIFGAALAFVIRAWLQQEAAKEIERVRAEYAVKTAKEVAADVEPMKAALGVAAAAAIEPMKAALAAEAAAALAREIEPLKATLAADTARAVAKEVEPLKNELAKDLETVRSLLTLDSEVRRRVAERKVTLLMALVDAANDTWNALHLSALGKQPDCGVDALNQTSQRIRVACALLTSARAKALWAYYGELQHGWSTAAQARVSNNNMAPGLERLGAASDTLVDFVREELLVTTRQLQAIGEPQAARAAETA